MHGLCMCVWYVCGMYVVCVCVRAWFVHVCGMCVVCVWCVCGMCVCGV